jgi:pyrimidine operon attenuation protein / uracil phosphoribosyltransferase
MTERTLILDPDRIQRMLERMAWQIVERHAHEEEVILVGISKSGFRLAERLHDRLQGIFSGRVTLAEISVNKREPAAGPTECALTPAQFQEQNIVVIDDVLNTGATLMYAVHYFLQAPIKRLSTAVLIDRNFKHFPIKADIKGMSLSTSLHDRVEVDLDGTEAVYLV